MTRPTAVARVVAKSSLTDRVPSTIAGTGLLSHDNAVYAPVIKIHDSRVWKIYCSFAHTFGNDVECMNLQEKQSRYVTSATFLLLCMMSKES
jgi:hypothetical protein